MSEVREPKALLVEQIVALACVGGLSRPMGPA